MPGTLANGGSVFEICPAQQSALYELMMGNEHKHHHTSDDGVTADAQNKCQWAQAFFALAFTLLFLLSLSIVTRLQIFKPSFRPNLRSFKLPIRGPPYQQYV